MSEAAVPQTFADRLRGFGPVGLLAAAAIVASSLLLTPLPAVLILAWAALSRTPWRELGFVRPRLRTLAIAAAAGAAFKILLKAAVMPLLGAPPVNAAYHYLAGNRAALPGILAAVIVGAGFGEEVFFRGWLFERLRKLLGEGATPAIVLFTSALFAAAHWQGQGLAGVEQAAITGLAFGTAYAIGGSLIPVMVAHAAFDVAAVAIIYFDAEAAFAHLLFR